MTLAPPIETSSAHTGMPIARVSVIAPMLNERAHVEPFVADIAAQDFAGDVEVIVADGGSTDGSVAALRAAAAQAGVRLTVIANPQRWASHGLNRCIEHAHGDLLIRLDCHSRYPSDYFRLCAIAAEETDALVVGGIVVAEGETPVQRAVAAAMDSAFGGIGFYRVFDEEAGILRRLGSAFGITSANRSGASRRVESDTATFGAFRPEAFSRAGLFDESLRRNQDDEFNLRLRLAGGRVILDPSIEVHYRPRASLRGVYRQYFDYGFWKVPVMLKHREMPRPRSLVPMAFVASVFILGLASVASPSARVLLGAELFAYCAFASIAGLASLRRRRETWRLAPLMLAVFSAFHIGYGLGMSVGWATTFAGRAPSGRDPDVAHPSPL